MLEIIEQKAIELYEFNMKYLEKDHNILFNKIKLFEEGLELGEIKERYSLEYIENYFDIYDNVKQEFLYNQDSYEYSKKRVQEINSSALENTFKTFYEEVYNDKIIELSKNASITSSAYIGNATISHYIQKNIPKEQEMKNIYKYFIFGVGLGIHITLLHEKMKAKKYLFIEPSLEIFRLSLFITNYEFIAKNSDVHFAIALNEKEFSEYISLLSDETFLYDQYIKFFMFSQNCDFYINIIQNFLVSQNHILYSYDRSIESFQRTYKYMTEKFNYLNLSENSNIFYKPVLLLAAGPSLSKDIEFVKRNKNRFIVVAIYVILPLLEKEGIIPDVVTQYDQQDKPVTRTLGELKNKELFNNCIFIFASHIVEEVMNFFPKKQIYLFQALYKVKENYKMLSAPSIGEVTYALLFHLGVKEIYLLGLDMALSSTGDSHSSAHGANFKGSDEIKKEEISFRNTKLTVKGNFRDEVVTLPLFKVSIEAINRVADFMQLKNVKVYNLSDGAYFNSVEPLKIKDIDIDKFEVIDKKDLQREIKLRLSKIASNKLLKKDKEYNLIKLKDANDLFKEVEKFHDLKYTNIDTFKKAIFKLFDNLIYKDCKCVDLQDILLNFYKHNLPYIFHFFNIKNLKDEKKHIKELNKIIFTQHKKIFEEYIKTIEFLGIK